jgi:hypothetical protein
MMMGGLKGAMGPKRAKGGPGIRCVKRRSRACHDRVTGEGAPQGRAVRAPKTSPKLHSISMFIGRQHTVQSSIMLWSPCEVSTLIVNVSPQYGHSISVSTRKVMPEIG